MDQEKLTTIIQDVSLDDLPNDDFRELASHMGMEAVVRIIAMCSGMQFYVPASALRTLRCLYIKKHYNGSNVSQLVQDTGWTYHQINKVVRELGLSKRQQQAQG